MRILVVHNDYGRYSGEEAVVDRFIADMRGLGHEVETLRRTSKFLRQSLLGRVKAYFSGLYSFEGVAMMREAIATFKPDVVNVHNLFPFISPASLNECRKAGVPVIMTVHNYRLICPTGLFLHDGKPCEECLKTHRERPCILHNCERNLSRSFAFAHRNKVARRRGFYLKNITYYACLTEFQREKLAAFGYPAERLVVIPNYPNPMVRSVSSDNICTQGMPDGFIGYVGRLSAEKGYDLLLKVAKRHPRLQFIFAGDSREEAQKTTLHNVHYCGHLNNQQLATFYRKASFVAIPSRCYEGLPMVSLEAFSQGKTCVMPNHGIFPSLAYNGDKQCAVLFAPGDVGDLEKAILSLANAPDRLLRLNLNAKEHVEQHFSHDIVVGKWQELLDKAINAAKSPRR